MLADLQNPIRSWKSQLPLALAAVALVALAGCRGSGPTEPEGEGGGGETPTGSVRMSSFSAAGSPAPDGGFSTEGVDPPGMPVVTVTRARFLVRNVDLAAAGGTAQPVTAGPVIVELHLGGQVTEIGIGSLPAATYDQLRYDIHRFDAEDPQDQQYASDPDFADFNTLTRPSMIIEGTVDDGTGAQPYVFESDDDVAQVKTLLASFALGEGQTANVTVAFDRRQWFPNGAGGNWDPRNPANEQAISDNVKNSVSVYLDQNRDGIPDGS